MLDDGLNHLIGQMYKTIIAVYIPLKGIAHKDSIKGLYFLLLNLVL